MNRHDMNKEGSVTVVGFVLKKDYLNFISLFKQILNVLKEYKIEGLKYSSDGENWRIIYAEDINREEIFEILFNAQLFNMDIEMSLNGIKTTLLIEKTEFKDCLSIDCCFYDNYMFASMLNNEIDNDYTFALEKYTEFCIMFVIKVSQVANFDYAYCDNDASSEYKLSEIMDGTSEEYSLIFIPDDNQIRILKSNWEIDGFTNRSNIEEIKISKQNTK